MIKTIIECYYWQDVKEFLKNNLPEKFEFKIWDIWKNLTCHTIQNGLVVKHSLYHMLLDKEQPLINFLNDYKEYPKEDSDMIFAALEKLKEHCNSDEITIYYKW